MVAFVKRMGAGFAGDISRKQNAAVEPGIANSSSLVYGNVVKLSSGKIVPFSGSEAAADVYGVLVRPFPVRSSTDGLTTDTPPSSGPVDVLKRGYINAKINGATDAAKGGTVYVRVASASAGKPIGGFEAAADSSNTIVVANAYYMGPRDANGISEIAFKI